MSQIQVNDNIVDDLSSPSPDVNGTEMDTVEENAEPESLSYLIKPEKSDPRVMTENSDVVKTQGDKENEKTGDEISEQASNIEEVAVLEPVQYISDDSTEYKKSEWLALLLFDVGLPTIDVYSDLSLVISWLCDNHWRYGLSMSIPLVSKFILITYKWCMIEKRKEKKWTWILLFIQIWPQWRALRIARLLYNGDKRAQLKKDTLVSEIRSIEPFIESVPTIMIMTMIMIQATFGILHIVSDSHGSQTDSQNLTVDCSKEQWDHWKINYCAAFGGLGGVYWFLITYSISLGTGAFGLTQFLQTGPCAILTQNGHLRGMLTWRFIIASFATMLSLVTKVVFAGIMMEIASELASYRGGFLGGVVLHEPIITSALIFFALNILPHIILSLTCVAMATGCSKKYFKIIFGYPALCLLPAFTYFVVGPKDIGCNTQRNQSFNQQKELIVSKKLTVLNMILTTILYCVVIGILWILGHDDIDGFGWFATVFTPILLIGIVINLIFLFLDQPCCFSKSQNCFCASCCGPNCYELRYRYINTASGGIIGGIIGSEIVVCET